MRTEYLRVAAYTCERCRGPVISGATAVRDNEISKETEIRQVGAICLSCGHRQNKANWARRYTRLPTSSMGCRELYLYRLGHLVSEYFEEINREEVH